VALSGDIAMFHSTRRELLKLGMGVTAASLLPGLAGAVAKADKPLRILILGGTGFTGPHQVRYALQRGHQITLFNRGRKPKQWPGEVEELLGDRDTGDYQALDGREWDVCIDNPTSVPVWVRDAAEVLKGRIGQYIFISTISVYADNSQPGMQEDAAVARYEGVDAMAETMAGLRANMALYGPLKALSEAEARGQFGADRVTVIRPGLIVGPGDETDRFTYWPVRIARGGEVAAPGDGSDPVQFIDARDLAEWTIRMAESRVIGTFNATGPNYEMSMAAMLHGIRACTTAGATLRWLPSDFLSAQRVQPWSDMPVWVPGTGESAGFARVSNARAIAQGLRFRRFVETVADTLSWFAEQPPERQASLRAGLPAAREQALLRDWAATS
jgi:2'-hydroxyisoflavone reductase